MKENLIEGLQDQITRVREIIKEYEKLPNNTGAFACLMMRSHIDYAERSISNGDTLGMIGAYKELEKYEL